MEHLEHKIAALEEQIKRLEVKAKFYEYQYEEEAEKVKEMERLRATQPYAYKYPHPAIATDCVIFSLGPKKKLQVLLIQRGGEPYKDCWALPGGFLQMADGYRETLEECAKRELFEETYYTHADLIEQLHVYSEVDRDPRERVISVAFYALVKEEKVRGGDDAKIAQWFSIDELPENLAFDHATILADAKEKLKEQIHFQPIGFDLLPETFTMSDLQRLYETILEVNFDRRNFYKKMNALGILDMAEERPVGTSNRIPIKYRFNKEVYEAFKKKGFRLEF